MRFKKPLALTLAAVTALLMLLVAALWLGARTPLARRSAGEYLAGLAGLPVTVGSLAMHFLPGPALEAEDLTIAQPPGFGGDPLIEIGRARVAVPWSAPFRRELSLQSVVIEDATLRPALAADGADNWSALLERLSQLGGEGESRWSIGRLAIDRGGVEFHDAATGERWRLTALTFGAETVAPGAEFPVELRFAGLHGAHTLHLAVHAQASLRPELDRYGTRALTLSGWIGGEPLPLAGVEFSGGIAVISFDAAVGSLRASGGALALAGLRGDFALEATRDDDGTHLVFSLHTGPFSPRRVATAFGRPLPATADPQALQSLQLTVLGRMEQGSLQLDPIEGRLDDTQWSGQASPELRRIRIHADRLDVDRYLAPADATPKEPKATLEAMLAELGRLDLDGEIRIDEARVAGATLREALLRIERDERASR